MLREPSKYEIFIYDKPNAQGKSGFDLYWKDHGGKQRIQCFRANVEEWIAERRARGHEVVIVEKEIMRED